MKKLLALGILTIGIFSLTACGKSNVDDSTSDLTNTITVGATSVPHAEILNEVVDNLAEKGITLNVKEFSDYTLLNKSLEDGEIDANFFQHTSYLSKYTEQMGDNLISVGAVHTEPMGIYSKTLKDLNELKEGDKVTIPNDDTNGARALALLEKNGLIEIKDGVGENATIFDIEKNPKNIEITELDAATLPRTLDDTAISVINTNYALEAGLDPILDAIAIEDSNSPFANILVVRKGEENNESIKILYEALTSEEIKNFIEEKYKGAVIPAF